MTHAKRYLLAIAIVAGLAGPGLASANDAGPVESDSAALTADSPTSSTEIPNPSVGELLAQLAEVRAEYAEFREAAEGKPSRLAFYGLLVAVLTMLIGVLNKAAHLSQRARSRIPLITGALGIGVGLFGSLSMDMSLIEAITVGVIPPLSVWLHQLIKQPGKVNASPLVALLVGLSLAGCNTVEADVGSTELAAGTNYVVSWHPVTAAGDDVSCDFGAPQAQILLELSQGPDIRVAFAACAPYNNGGNYWRVPYVELDTYLRLLDRNPNPIVNLDGAGNAQFVW